MPDSVSVCSDDTDLLLSMPSSGFKDAQRRGILNRTPDKFSMTEKYIRGLSSDMLEKNWNYRGSTQSKSPFTSVGKLNIKPPLHTTHDEARKKTYANNNNFGSDYYGYSIKQDINQRSSIDFIKTPSYGTSILPNRRNGSFSASSKISYNISPPKTVKFEDSIDDDNDDVNVECYQSYSEKPDSLGKDAYGSVYPYNKDDDFDIDEKVREGKEILERLLKSTETKRCTEKKRVASYENSHSEDEEDQSFIPIKSPLSSSWNETDEIIALGSADFSMDLEADTNILVKDFKERKEPYLMSTRLDINDEKTPIISHKDSSLINTTDKLFSKHKTKKVEEVADGKLLEEIKVLKEELSSQEVNSFLEMKSLKEDNEKTVAKLYAQVSNLTQQKDTLEDYITQLKCSLTKKNDKCFELQEQLHKKLTFIHQLTTNDDKDRQNLQNEVSMLHGRKRNLEEQIGKMETSLKIQYEEIKELEKRFQREKQSNIDMLRKKDEDISSLHRQIEMFSEQNKAKKEEMKADHQIEIENALLRGKTILQPEIDEMKVKLDLELERQARLQSKHQSEVNHLKSNFETLRTANVKLKQDLEASRQQNQDLEKCNIMNIKNARDEAEMENDLLKKKLIECEKIQKSMALELIEESTKLAVICGTPASTRVSSPDAYVDCNIMSEALIVFKEHLENFRHYTLSLRNESNQPKSESNEDGSIHSGSGQTSAKLLRHLQNRVQQLRKENEMLHASSICENCHGEIKSNMSDDTDNLVEEEIPTTEPMLNNDMLLMDVQS